MCGTFSVWQQYEWENNNNKKKKKKEEAHTENECLGLENIVYLVPNLNFTVEPRIFHRLEVLFAGKVYIKWNWHVSIKNQTASVIKDNEVAWRKPYFNREPYVKSNCVWATVL